MGSDDMCRFNAVLAGFFLAAATVYCQSAAAQIYGYNPQGPAISPWMGLWQKNTGPFNNYQSVVLPQQQLSQTLQMQSAALARQQASLMGINNALSQGGGTPSGGMMPTGEGASFMNYSHYFGGNGGIGLSQGPVRARPGTYRAAGLGQSTSNSPTASSSFGMR